MTHDTRDLVVGDTVVINNFGSWTHNRVATIIKLDAVGPIGERGCLLGVHGFKTPTPWYGVTIVHPALLTRRKDENGG